jgi:type VII secretion-associated serine protease mycosin
LGQPVAFAEPTAAVEVQPPDTACTYNNSALAQRHFPAAAVSQQPWAQQRLQYQQAWQYSTGAGVRVAVVDTGVDASNQQLRPGLVTGLDLSGAGPTPGGTTGCAAHGTMVAGIIAARPVPGIGFAGVAPAATIIPIRETWGVDGQGNDTRPPAAKLAEAINQAVNTGAQVVNVSITVPVTSLTPAVRQAFVAVAQRAQQSNVMIVAATGNTDGNNDARVANYPAALAARFDSVIAVGGIDRNGALYQGSVYGGAVTVVAPADNVVTTFIPRGSYGSALQYAVGTSFATPFVSGTVALLKSRYPRMTLRQIKYRVEMTADHPSTDLPDQQLGYGVVNPVAALTEVVTDPPSAAAKVQPPLAPPTPPDETTRTVALAVAGGATLVTLGVLTAAVVIRRGRRRNWQPGARPELSGSR